jgi:predicted enzyme involved in methoxymalonyl-ACP biosynthesis
LHQALDTLRTRGILLATVSRNPVAPVMEAWSKVAAARREADFWGPPFLGPEDFVAHHVGAESKSSALVNIASKLALPMGALAFIDDHPGRVCRGRHSATRNPETMVACPRVSGSLSRSSPSSSSPL